MTAVPLVASMLVASIGSIAFGRALARTAARALVLSVALLAVAAAASFAIARPAFARLPLDRGAAQALGGATAAPAVTAPGTATPRSPLAQWVVDLVPQNAIRAAADDLMLPTIVFSLLFGAALSQLPDQKRTLLVGVADAIAAAMQRLVAMILAVAPLGVFALAVPLAARLGSAAAGAVVAYIVLVVGLTAAGTALLYPLGMLGARIGARAFASLCAPAQAVAFASRSSLAALPAMLESAARAGYSRDVTGVILPLAASTFRFGAAVAQTVGVVFLARLYAVDLGAAQFASIVAIVVFTSFAVPGIPGGSIIAMVPVLSAAHIPVEGVGILLAVDTIPDMFRTTANVTGSMAVAVAVSGE